VSKKKVKAIHKSHGGGYIPMCHIVLKSAQFASLSSSAVKLYMDLLSQYTGFNNGTLTVCFDVMVKRGWRSRETLRNAKRELLEKKFLKITRVGGKNKSFLYGLTTYSLDKDKENRYDDGISETDAPSGEWRPSKMISVVAPLRAANEN